MAIEVTVQLGEGAVVVNIETDAPYSPDVAEDLLRRTRESALAAYAELPDYEPDHEDPPPIVSLYLRLVIGPIVVCDVELFGTAAAPQPSNEPPPQLAGGQAGLNYPEPASGEIVPESFGFCSR